MIASAGDQSYAVYFKRFNAARLVDSVLVTQTQLTPIVKAKHEHATCLGDHARMLVAARELHYFIIFNVKFLRLKSTLSANESWSRFFSVFNLGERKMKHNKQKSL